MAARRLRLESLEDRRVLAVNVVPSVETDAATAADDAANWIHPTDTAQSTIIGTAKTSSNALRVFDLAGNELQRVAAAEVNNVDLRYNFPLSGQSTTIVTGSNRSNNSIVVYRVNPATRLLENVAAGTIGTGMDIYGLAMYVSPVSGKYYTFVTSESGQVQQWELFDNGANKVDATLVRSFNVGSQSEGLVADDVLSWLYVGEEDEGIWKYSAEPNGGNSRTEVDSTGGGGNLDADVEGLTIYYESDGTGYLIASSQGNSEFAVYRREGNNQHLDNFKLIAGGGIDAVTDTDGIDVTNFPLGSAFPQGMFVAQDNDTNFKLARWDAIDTVFGGLLDVDTTWDPRAVGAPQSSTVVGRHLFYNQSAFDGNAEEINAISDEAARATDKSPYLPNGTIATFENVSSFSRGVTGIMIDLSTGVSHAGLTFANAANNFVFKVGDNNAPGSWTPAPIPTAISAIPGGGISGSDRVEITWATGSIRNQWLEVQVLATAQTGLAAPDVFFWGSRIADSGTSPGAATFDTTTTDAAQVFALLGSGKPTTDLRDYNRDGSVTTTDAALVFANLGSLTRISVGGAGPFSPTSGENLANMAFVLAQPVSPNTVSLNVSTPPYVEHDATRAHPHFEALRAAGNSLSTNETLFPRAAAPSSAGHSVVPQLNSSLGPTARPRLALRNAPLRPASANTRYNE